MMTQKSKTPFKKVQLLKEIKQGLKEVKLIREGKAKAYTMADLLVGNNL